MPWTIEDATTEDLPTILAIYNDVIATTNAVYTEVPSTLDERAAWLADRRANDLPVLVARDEDGTVGGLASFGPFRPWPGYAATVEHSVHVDRAVRRQGLGRLLLTDLLAAATARGYAVMVGGIDGANDGSLALHEQLGFTYAGTLHGVARKFGSTLDLVFVERRLS